ncbi:MAG: tetratricopeptide repeat protein [Deltaproteobacteria bacterium]|nr:tetratricopeptide repeat protein [Deltaproteobacteria bacterium]
MTFRAASHITLILLLLAPTIGWGKKLIKPTERAVEHNNKGALLIDQGRLMEAEFQLKTAIQLSPQYAEAYNNLGVIYKQRKDYDTALSYFEKAYGLNNKYIAPLSHMGAVHIARGHYAQAITLLRKAVDKEPTFADALYNLGLAYLMKAREAGDGTEKTKFYKEAEKHFTIATQLSPQHIDAHLNLGDLYVETGELEKAEIRYRLALEDNPQRADIYQQLARLLQQRGKGGEAAHIAQQGSQIAQDQAAKAAFDRGVKAMEEGETLRSEGKNDPARVAFTQATAAFEEATRLRPIYTEAFYGLGVARERLANHKGARTAWEMTLKQHPHHPGALFNLGTLSMNQGRTSEGLVYLCEFLQYGGSAYPEQRATVMKRLQESTLQCPSL